MSYPIEVRKSESVKLQKGFVDLRKNIKYKDPKITNNIKQNRLLRKQTRRIETIQNFKERFKKGVQLIGISLLVIGVVSHNFNFKFDTAFANIELNSAQEEQDIDKEMDKIIDEVLQPEENINDYKEEFQEDIKQEILEKKKEERKAEIKKVTEEKEYTKEEQELFNFIIGGEGSFQEKAFCDSYYILDGHLIREKGKYCDRYSIGYGTISYEGEVITKEEAHKRMVEVLDGIYNKVPDCFKTNEKIAITDYQYQFGQYSQNINTYIQRCDKKSVKFILYPYGKYTKGIENRRERGYNYFNK